MPASKYKRTNIVYTYTDTSQYFLQEIKTKLEGFKGIEYELLDLNRNLTQQQVQKHTYWKKWFVQSR